MENISIFLCYGEGGHMAQMERLYNLLIMERGDNKITYVGICEGKHDSKKLINHKLLSMRSKYSFVMSIFMLAFVSAYNFLKSILLIYKYRPTGMISTGPGSAIIPAVLFKLLRKKIIYIETWSRFNTISSTGKCMYKLADRFYIQNIELKGRYPDAIYAGLL
jgi:UDP-N-acetylglucosamine:LPS N-acetylglucosamine transferase